MYAVRRSLLQTSALRQGIQFTPAGVRQVTMQVVQPTEEKTIKESFMEKNERLGRALSPHLTIYRPQLTTMLSISHRGTGLVLSAYVTALGLGALMAPQDISHYATIIEGLHMNAATLMAAKFIFAYPFAYHTCNGVRHLIWDTGRCLKIKEVYSSGYIMVAASFVLAGILAAL